MTRSLSAMTGCCVLSAFLFAVLAGCGSSNSRPAPDATADARNFPDVLPVDLGCFMLCIAQNTEIQLSGYVELAGADSGAVDVDSLQVTVCLDSQCAVLPRESWYDSQASQWACADAATTCGSKVFGSNSSDSYMYAYVTVTHNAGDFYSVSGSVMFPFQSPGASAAGSTGITIQSAGVTYLNASSSDCTVSIGCCGHLSYQQCNLTWN